MFGAIIRAIFGTNPRGRNVAGFSRRSPWHADLPPKKVSEKHRPDRTPTTPVLRGKCHVIDGDTIVISGTKIRLAGIDAPELNHPWGKKSKYALIAMCKNQIIEARITEEVSYDRIVASCHLSDGTDLAAELVKQGLALDWAKFSGGRYRHLEPEGARKRLWRSAAKHQGRFRE